MIFLNCPHLNAKSPDLKSYNLKIYLTRFVAFYRTKMQTTKWGKRQKQGGISKQTENVNLVYSKGENTTEERGPTIKKHTVGKWGAIRVSISRVSLI